MAPKEILDLPVTYDIVLGDFGRVAAIRYVSLSADAETRILRENLCPRELEFYDEYRRIMYSLVGDVGFIKGPRIEELKLSNGRLTEGILVGMAWNPTPPYFLRRLHLTIFLECAVAARKGYSKFRVVVPCNGLSSYVCNISSIASDQEYLRSLEEEFLLAGDSFEPLTGCSVSVETVPQNVVDSLKPNALASDSILILGTRIVNADYSNAGRRKNLNTVELSDRCYDLIDNAIKLSIEGRPEALERCRTRILEEIIVPVEKEYGSVTIVEACTDFNFNLGLDSLSIYAERLVEKAYNPFHFKTCSAS